MTTKVWVPISVCPRGSCWLPRPVSAHSWFLPCLPPQSAADGEEAVWWHSSARHWWGGYLSGVSNPADRGKDECVSHGIMGRRFPDRGLLRYRKWVPQQLGDFIIQGSGDSQPMGARHGDTAANHNSTHFLLWSTGALLILFGRPDGKLFLSFLPILLCLKHYLSLL